MTTCCTPFFLNLTFPHQRAINCAKDNNLSVWLTVLPVAANNFDVTAQEFHDGFAVHYRKLSGTSHHCDGCNAASSLYLVQRHNKLHDTTGDLATLLWGQVRSEPIVFEDSVDDKGLVPGLGIWGVWSPQTKVLFNVHVCDTDTQSYLGHTPALVLLKAEAEKKSKYSTAATVCRAHFSPLYFSVDGLAGPKASSFLQQLAAGLVLQWKKHYSEVLYWIRAILGLPL